MFKVHQKKTGENRSQTHLDKKVGFALKSLSPPVSGIEFPVQQKATKKATVKKTTGKPVQKKSKLHGAGSRIKDAIKQELSLLAHKTLDTFQSGIMIKDKGIHKKELIKGWTSIKKEDLANPQSSKHSNKIVKKIVMVAEEHAPEADHHEVMDWIKAHGDWIWNSIAPWQAKITGRMVVKPISTAGKKRAR